MVTRIGLLTGPIGVGKTTVAEGVVRLAHQQGFTCGGLLAPAIKDSCNQKVGIWGIDIQSGERRILARTDRHPIGPSIGPYHFDQDALDWAIARIEQAVARRELLIVDEIGKLELQQGVGLAPILPLLTSSQVSHALVLVRNSLLAELRARLVVVEQIEFYVTEQNRVELPPLVLENLMLNTGMNPLPTGG
jgi:nucleoside-triphosphatase THEP1